MPVTLGIYSHIHPVRNWTDH